MAIVEYPFTAPDKYKHYGPQPYLPINIINPDSDCSTFTWGLIDTGAFTCRLPEMYADLIEVDTTKKRPMQGETGGGLSKGFTYPCCIEILEMDRQGKVCEDSVEIRISKTDFAFGGEAPFVLLGVREFLKNYRVTIDYPRKVFSILQ